MQPTTSIADGSRPTVMYIPGDGIGPEVWNATQIVIDHAVQETYGASRRIVWQEALAGEKAFQATGQWLPDATIEKIRAAGLAIKGPLTTPVGGGFRSLNVTLRQALDLYACVRPVRYIAGVPSPMRHPEAV
ncbi:MAG: isocitrate/isopropylmalate family dehydrogenase, partial [Firmicutes bacterium]|nr:isocitrate/isopropylmalate family dehydrogenase [Bacillota bacterium]